MKLQRKTLVGRLGEDAVAHADVKAAGALYGFARCVIDLEPTESVVGLVLLKAHRRLLILLRVLKGIGAATGKYFAVILQHDRSNVLQLFE